MKLLTKINNKTNISDYISLTDGFIIGLRDYSVDYEEFSLEEIKILINKYKDKEFFIALNKNIFNSELDNLEKILSELDKLNIKGILFYDMSILYLKKKNNFDINLVWNQTHMVTNYNTCNYYFEKGVNYAFVSGEITLDEIIEINKKSNINLLVEVVGHQVMSHSRRKLLTNYYSSIGKKLDSDCKVIDEKEERLIVKENKTGTTFKTDKILNGIPILENLKENNISYVVLDEDFMEKDVVKETLKIINEIINNHNVEQNIEKSYLLLGDNTSFLFKKTIYKVKKGDK